MAKRLVILVWLPATRQGAQYFSYSTISYCLEFACHIAQARGCPWLKTIIYGTRGGEGTCPFAILTTYCSMGGNRMTFGWYMQKLEKNGLVLKSRDEKRMKSLLHPETMKDSNVERVPVPVPSGRAKYASPTQRTHLAVMRSMDSLTEPVSVRSGSNVTSAPWQVLMA